MARRLSCIKTTAKRYAGTVDDNGWTGKLNFVPSELEKVYKWKQPRRIFVGSMTDIFHYATDGRQHQEIAKCIRNNPQHTFLLLTKRASDMRYWLGCVGNKYYADLPNIWAGVTVENQEQADLRIPELLRTPLHPLAKRWISVEPMLGEINLNRWLKETCTHCGGIGATPNHPHIVAKTCTKCNGTGKVYNSRLDWVVCGGENGGNCRTMKTDWALELYRQCKKAETSFWFKGWGGGEVWRSNADMELIWDMTHCKELPR
jgi:protein gp37